MTAKTDMERIGLFKEMGYHSVGDPYLPPTAIQFNQSATKGKQILPGGDKIKSGTNVGYFSEFSRVFNGEAYTDIPKMRRQQRIADGKKKLGKDWVPANGLKLPSGAGSNYGTFSGAITHFEAIGKVSQKKGNDGKNFYTNPPKKGTGYGYIGVSLNKYPEYKSEKYDRNRDISKQENDAHRSKISNKGVFHLGMHGRDLFDVNPFTGPTDKYRSSSAGPKTKDSKIFRPSNPAKLDGGMKAGCFSTFPTYSSEPYRSKSLTKIDSNAKKFMPSAGPKSRPTNSIINQNVIRSITSMNYRQMQSVMSY